jgi:hypothetical protein
MVNLKVTLGTVNYTNFLHVTASKVASPSSVVWQTWIDVPVSNYNFIIPGLDPENYYVRYYDAPTNSALGTLAIELLVNAVTGDTIMERRFYTCGDNGSSDPVDGANQIIDSYLIGKNLTGCFKEGFRYLIPDTDYVYYIDAGRVDIVNGTAFSTGEVFAVEIKYNTGISAAPVGAALYSGTLTVTEATKTLTAVDKDKRIRCVGTGSTQVITLPTLASVAVENGFYFDNTCGGVATQVKIVLPGSEKIRYNGFMAASDLFAEFWVSKGEHLLIRKFDDTYWEVITDYKGIEVGNRQAATYNAMPGWLPEDGRLLDGDEYPRLWWWLNTIVPNTHYIVDDTVTGSGYTHPAAKVGQFVLHSSLKKFRLPNTQNISEKGLKGFTTFGTDSAARPIDYPGGFQNQAIMSHGHTIPHKKDGSGSGGFTVALNGAADGSVWNTSDTGGAKNIVENFGVIYLRKI